MSADLLDPEEAIVAMVDVQERHFPTVPDGAACLSRLVPFLRACRAIGVPVVWTEHHPRGFGPTLEPVRSVLEGLEPIAKTSFGCFGEPRFASAIAESGRRVLVLAGTETAICILQTGLGALASGMGLVVVADCVASRYALDHDLALRRLEREGAVLVTWEALVYEWMRNAQHPSFKAVLALVKGEGGAVRRES